MKEREKPTRGRRAVAEAPDGAERENLLGRIAELEDALIRSRADHDNYRKRMERERLEWAAEARAALLAELLPVVVHLELGLEAAKDPAFANLVSGFALVLDRLRTTLGNQGVAAIGAPGEVFDPRWQEAMAVVEDDSMPADRVVRVVRRGYRLGERLLRPATVTISGGRDGEEAKDGAEAAAGGEKG